MSTTVDRWDAMTLHLSGAPLPILPAIPGRLHTAPPVTAADPLADAWDADNTHAKRPTAESTT